MSLFNLYDQPQSPPFGTDEYGNRVTPYTGMWNNPFGASNVGGPNNLYRPATSKPGPIIGQQVQNPSFNWTPPKTTIQPLISKPGPTVQPPPKKSNVVPQRQDEQRIAGQYSQSNAQNKAYSLLRSQANMTTQQKQGQGWGEMRKQLERPQSVSAMYIRGNALTQAIKSVEQRNFWANAYQQLNAALRPVNIPLTTPQNTGGGYGYGGYSYGGGGGYKKQAQPLDSVVWRMNQ